MSGSMLHVPAEFRHPWMSPPIAVNGTSTQVSAHVSVHTLITVGDWKRTLSSRSCMMHLLAFRFQCLCSQNMREIFWQFKLHASHWSSEKLDGLSLTRYWAAQLASSIALPLVLNFNNAAPFNPNFILVRHFWNLWYGKWHSAENGIKCIQQKRIAPVRVLKVRKLLML